MINVEIINTLRRNSRASLAKLSRKLRSPVTSIYYRLGLLEKSCVLKYVSLINFEILGYRRYFFIINVARRAHEVCKSISGFGPENNVHISSKGIFIECVFKDISEFDSYIYNLEKKGLDFEYFPLLQVIKQEAFTI